MNHRNTLVVIPAAGMASADSWQAIPKAMHNVLGKPFLLYTIDRLIGQGFCNFAVIENSANDSISTLLKSTYLWNPQLKITTLKQDRMLGPLYAISLAANQLESEDLLIWLGDTFCSTPIDFKEDTVLVGEVHETFRWCIAETDENKRVKRFLDKVQIEGTEQTHIALAGIYYLSHAKDFFEISKTVLSEKPAHTGYFEISQALTRYNEKNRIRTQQIEGWVDVGNQDVLLATMGRLFSARNFNRLEYDSGINVIRKTSDAGSVRKLRNEIFWMQNVPQTCRRFLPEVVEANMDAVQTSLSLEFIPYPSLASSYVFQKLPAQKWKWAVDHVLQTFERYFWSQSVDSPLDAQKLFFDHVFGKLRERVSAYPEKIPQNSEIDFNGRKLPSLSKILPLLEKEILRISKKETKLAIMHGDLCFSNILFDLSSGLFKTIDPRGSYASLEPTVFGSPLYDLAKLRHSIAGLYDSMAFDIFRVESDGTRYQLSVHKNPVVDELSAHFDEVVLKSGRSPLDVRLIEATLFLSMVPMHAENPHRQLAFYLTGLSRAQEALEK